MNSKPTAVIADDHPVVLAGLAPYIERRGIEVVAIAASADALLAVLANRAGRPPQVVITGYDYGGMADGLRLIERIHRQCPQARIVVFAAARPIGLVRQLLDKGADAFVAKSSDPRCVADACHAALSGGRYIDPATERLLAASPMPQADPFDDALSPREREVLRLLEQGCPLQEIAQRFHRSVKTISVQKCSAMSKLGLRNDLELALYLVLRSRAGLAC